MAEWQRTHTCGELRDTHIGQAVVLNGWVNTFRSYNDQVFVEVEPWVFEPRRVDVAFQEGDQAMIGRGLKGGERVVVKGGVLLND